MKKAKPNLTILRGDMRETLFQLRPESVQCCITSPPYWSVRDYETPAIDHPEFKFTPAVGLPPIIVPAWQGQLGLELDPWHYIGHLVHHFSAVARVLRADGTLWVNIGDTYYTGDGTAGINSKRTPRKITHATTPNRLPIAGYKPKDLVGIPWMFAKAMQAAGWWLRGDIIWHKPNPMPSSQKDRPTTAHEYVFLFSRSEHYFYDNVAIHEPASDTPQGGVPAGWDTGDGTHTKAVGRYRQSARRGELNGKTEAMPGRNAFRAVRKTREKRTVWSIPTESYKGAHFATFPTGLVRPCILAGTSAKGACPDCGAPWMRLTELAEETQEVEPNPATDVFVCFGPPPAFEAPKVTVTRTTGWRPTCVCGAHPSLNLLHDDLEEFETPTGVQLGDDISVQQGGRGKDRETVNTGKRLITKFEHRMYARQLLASPMRKQMEAEAAEAGGKHAFEHYTRTDPAGARPIPPELLKRWIDAQWLIPVAVPQWEFKKPVPCVVLDCFGGSGTTAQVAIEEGRRAAVCEIAEHYWPLIDERTSVTPALLSV